MCNCDQSQQTGQRGSNRNRWIAQLGVIATVGVAVGGIAIRQNVSASAGSAAGSASTVAIGSGSGSALPPLPINILPVHPQLAAAVNAGSSWRIEGPRGPIRVWRPAGYHADGAATVVYVHGFYNDVDSAWREHQLPEQFARAGINATFIAVEAPSSGRQGVFYSVLAEVLQTVERETASPRASGPLVAVGHSGAFRTLMAWLDEPLLTNIILLDALYGENDIFTEWYNASNQHRLVNVGDDTLRWTEVMAMDIEDTVTVDYFPTESAQWSKAARDARHLYVRSQFGHMQIVTAGVAIPLLLRLIPAEVLPTSPWQLPILPLRGPFGVAAPAAGSAVAPATSPELAPVSAPLP
jgi:hypothetical protein